MQSVNKDSFLTLVRMGIGHRCAFPDVIDWQSIKTLADKQGLTAIIVDGIEQLPDTKRPPKELLLQWIGEVFQMLPGSKNTVKMGIGVQQNREQEYSKNGNKNTVISINIINQGLHCIINKKQDCDGLKNKITYHYVSRDSQAS